MLWDKLSANFRGADTSKDNELDRQEFSRFCEGLGLRRTDLVNKMFDSIDADYSGKISLYEFI